MPPSNFSVNGQVLRPTSTNSNGSKQCSKQSAATPPITKRMMYDKETEERISNQVKWFRVRYPNDCRYLYVDSNTYGWVWVNICMFIILHIVFIYGLYRLLTYEGNKLNGWLFCNIYGHIAGIGVTSGAHRLWSHRAYEAKLPLRILLVFAHTMAGQNDMYTWVRDHRLHHKYSETDADPHNSRRGMFFAHVGWLMTKKHPDVLIKGKTVDMSDVESDPVIQFQRRYYFPLYIICRFFIPIYIPVVIMGEQVNHAVLALFGTYIESLHCTWFVNSAAHWLGDKTYNDKIQPRNNVLVSVTTLGEGFHNFHHTFPWDYTIGEFEWGYNLGMRFIEIMSKLGLAYNLKRVPEEQLKRTRELITAKHEQKPLYDEDHPYLYPHDFK